jgi:preprotein translocase subunit SecD
VISRLGDAYSLAQSIQDPRHLDAGTLDRLIGFGQLSPAEVQLLPAEIQFNVPAVTCAQLLARPDFRGTPFQEKITTCYGTDKVLLDAAKLTSDDVASAEVEAEQGTGRKIVGLTFAQPGSAKLAGLTREAVDNSGVTKCDDYAKGDRGGCFVALCVGASLFALSEVQSVLESSLPLWGDFAAGQAEALAQLISNDDPALTLHVVRTEVWDAPKATPTSGP